MKKFIAGLSFVAIAFMFQSCTKTESDFSMPATVTQESISIKSDVAEVIVGTSITFTVISSINNTIVTGQSKLYVNGDLITGNSYVFSQAGTFAVYALKGTLTSNVISVKVNANVPTVTNFVDRVLVEEYSGTWCGNCPAILYGVDLVHQQTDKAIVVSTHLFNGDPFITSQGNSLAASLGISGVPSGRINRTTAWNGLQYQNVNQVINEIQVKESLGLGIRSIVNGNNIDATITISYGQAITGEAKLTLYLVEDKLFYTQRNYSSTLYSGQANIPNFQYDGVLRSIVSNLTGDVIDNNGIAVKKTYSFTLPANIANIANVKLVAFVTNNTGKVINAQEAKAGTVKELEKL